MVLWIWILLLFLFLFLTGIFICYVWITMAAKPYLYNSKEDFPARPNILLLGTAKLTRDGKENLFFSNRIKKAVEIYQLKKADKLIISGADKVPQMSNEVADMFEDLSQKKIPAEAIIKDPLGFRTWASIWRCNHVYNTSSPIIVSQKFHNQRAVFIALRMKMHPIAVNAEKVKGKSGFLILIRETLARVKCIIDCYILRPIPREK